MASQTTRPLPKEKVAGELTVVRFTGPQVSLDEHTLHGIRDELLALADEPGESELVLDFGNVEYVSGMALGTLVSLHKNLIARGRHMTIRDLTPHVHEVFVVTRLDELLDLRPAEKAKQTSEGCPAGSPTSVLVVDDETGVLCVLAARLRHEGFQVRLAAHGHQAIELYRRHREEIAVVLLDVLMPGIDGPHTLTALQKLCPTVCCCFMTGNPAPYTEEALLQMGAVRVFQKPFAFAEVIDTLNQLAKRSPRRRRDRWIVLRM
jgi:anti-anti-sigma factor